MSSTLASLLVLALFVVAVAPLLIIRRSILVLPLAGMYGLIFAAIVAYNVGLFSRSALASTDLSGIRTAAAPPAECDEVLTLLERNEVILDRRTPTRLVVRQSLWAQLPQEAQAAVLACMESNRPTDDTGGPVQVVNR